MWRFVAIKGRFYPNKVKKLYFKLQKEQTNVAKVLLTFYLRFCIKLSKFVIFLSLVIDNSNILMNYFDISHYKARLEHCIALEIAAKFIKNVF